MAACRPQNRSNRENQKKFWPYTLPKGILTPSFIEIALAVTKRALRTDDDDGCQVIAIAHLGNMQFQKKHVQYTNRFIFAVVHFYNKKIEFSTIFVCFIFL
jgi:hypothetical protein